MITTMRYNRHNLYFKLQVISQITQFFAECCCSNQQQSQTNKYFKSMRCGGQNILMTNRQILIELNSKFECNIFNSDKRAKRCSADEDANGCDCTWHDHKITWMRNTCAGRGREINLWIVFSKTPPRFAILQLNIKILLREMFTIFETRDYYQKC